MRRGIFKLIILDLLLLLTLFFIIFEIQMHGDKKYSNRSNGVDKLYIDTPKENTYGSLTIYDGNGNVSYAYYGEIIINNSGKNGKPINVVIYKPDARN